MNITNYSTSICPFESIKCGKEEEKLQKFEYLENEKSLLDGVKNIFLSFGRATTWWKNKKLIKNSTHKLWKQKNKYNKNCSDENIDAIKHWKNVVM